ncbi:MAG: hypothetical protein HQM08_01385 [Candidatus Riflebacteria bacterium]|nr:hypothetical protein [Candidatus Riflebacteria bacterium]
MKIKQPNSNNASVTFSHTKSNLSYLLEMVASGKVPREEIRQLKVISETVIQRESVVIIEKI